jgi:hypothetical protein
MLSGDEKRLARAQPTAPELVSGGGRLSAVLSATK